MSVADNIAHFMYFLPVSVSLQSQIPCGLLHVIWKMLVRCIEERTIVTGPLLTRPIAMSFMWAYTLTHLFSED